MHKATYSYTHSRTSAAHKTSPYKTMENYEIINTHTHTGRRSVRQRETGGKWLSGRHTYTSARIVNITTHKCLAEKSNLIVAKMSKTALALYINIKQKAREIISGNYNYKCSHVVPAVPQRYGTKTVRNSLGTAAWCCFCCWSFLGSAEEY